MQQAIENKAELLEILETLDPSQLRLVLSFIKNLFDL
jgi:hypothetical protein